jgi:hypothetical protein
MEGGITVFLTLLILVAVGVAGFGMFGTGGRLRKQQLEGELDGEEKAARPEHTILEDDAPVVHKPGEFRRRDERS